MVLANTAPFINPVEPFNASSVFNVAGGADPVTKTEDLVAKAEPAQEDGNFSLRALIDGKISGLEGMADGIDMSKMPTGAMDGFNQFFEMLKPIFEAFGMSGALDNLQNKLNGDDTAVADAKAEEPASEEVVTFVPINGYLAEEQSSMAFDPDKFSLTVNGDPVSNHFNLSSTDDPELYNRFGSQEELRASFDQEPKPEELVQGNDFTSNIGLGVS